MHDEPIYNILGTTLNSLTLLLFSNFKASTKHSRSFSILPELL